MIIFVTCARYRFGEVPTDFNETWCERCLRIYLPGYGLWSGELGIYLQNSIKTSVYVTVLLVDAGFPLLAVTESALHH